MTICKSIFKKIKAEVNPREFSLLGLACAHQEDGSLFLSLPALEEDIVDDLDPQHGREPRSPYKPKLSTKEDDDLLLNEEQYALYRSTVAKGQYLGRHTRPDLLTAFMLHSVNVNEPTLGDLRSLQYAARYLHTTQGKGIYIAPSNLQLHASADASHLLHADCKGQTGFCIWLGEQNAPLLAYSGKQKLHAGGSMEAELIALASCSKQITHFAALCADMECPQFGPATIQQDNKSLLACFKRGSYKGSTKHITTRFQHLMSQKQDGVIDPVYVASQLVRANPFTKPCTLGHHFWADDILNTPKQQ